MPYREFHYRWEYDLQSSPEKLWPFVADTNRFNRDTGLPSIEVSREKPTSKGPGRKRLRFKVFGVPVEWEEMPFEWIHPSRLVVVRNYLKGPIESLRVLIQLNPRSDGGTRVAYEVWARPKSLLGVVAIPLQIGIFSARSFRAAYRKYDELAMSGEGEMMAESRYEISPAGQKRLEILREKLVDQGVNQRVANQLVKLVGEASDIDLARIRPYALADSWNERRRALLEACFHATRIGLLDLQWDLLCPMCRGPQETSGSLQEIHSRVHCEGCQIDFNVSFDRFVELTFRPNTAVRSVDPKTFCVSSPQRTPHVVAQQLLPAKTDRDITMTLAEGRYRVRVVDRPGEQLFVVKSDGPRTATVEALNFNDGEIQVATNPTLRLVNNSDAEQLFVIERTAWSDQAATAAEVTALQIFRDLFSREALRPGDQISVGTLTVLFTDLKNSTRLYRDIGDATAFGRVMNHFDVLKKAIADEDGALVKTIGDAIMAVFRHPASALRAMLTAQQVLASPPDDGPPLTLKAGIHIGPCIAVTLNDRLDYFGSTVNMAARLEGLSTGDDVIISRAVYDDPDVRELIAAPEATLQAESFDMMLKGFDEERFELWRVRPKEMTAKAEERTAG